MIDFNQPDYSVNEGVSVSAEVQVMSGITLDRDVVVTVQTVDGSGTAGMVVRVGGTSVHSHVAGFQLKRHRGEAPSA